MQIACRQTRKLKSFGPQKNSKPLVFSNVDSRESEGMSSSFKYNELAEESDLLDLKSVHANSQPSAIAYPVDYQEAQQSSSAIPQGRMNSKTLSERPTELRAVEGSDRAPPAIEPMNFFPEFLKYAAHPFVCLFHIIFKCLSILTYWIIYAITKDIVLTFILTTIFFAADFWTVKNVTGRILVGLRWWNKINEDGTSEWMFESGVDRSQVSALDKNVFWIGLYVFPLYWVAAAISNFLSFSPNFVVLNLMGLAFAGTNALGYTKCSRAGQQAVSDWATGQAMKIITGNVMQNLAPQQQV